MIQQRRCSLTQLYMAKQQHKAIFRSIEIFIWLQVKNKGLVLVETVDILDFGTIWLVLCLVQVEKRLVLNS